MLKITNVALHGKLDNLRNIDELEINAISSKKKMLNLVDLYLDYLQQLSVSATSLMQKNIF